MLPTLPPELHSMILCCLDELLEDRSRPQGSTAFRFWNHDTERMALRSTLKACSLVCRSWYETCRESLMKRISLRLYTRSHLDTMLSHLRLDSTRTDLTTELFLTCGSPERAPTRFPEWHTGIHYLPAKFRNLQYLWLVGFRTANHSFDPTALQISKLFMVNFGQFRALKELSIKDHQFYSFWDLRRLVVCPPSLTTLRLSHVGFGSPFQEPKIRNSQFLYSTPVSLSMLEFDKESSPVRGDTIGRRTVLWLWTTSLPLQLQATLVDVGHISGPNIRPSFLIQDVIEIRNLLNEFIPKDHDASYRWSYNDVTHIWDFTIKDKSVNEWQINWPSDWEKSRWDARGCQITFHIRSKSPPRPKSKFSPLRVIASITGISYEEQWEDFPPPAKWMSKFGELVSGLEELRELQFISDNESTGGDHLKRSTQRLKARESAQVMRHLLDREGFSLTFEEKGRIIQWNSEDVDAVLESDMEIFEDESLAL